MIRLCEECGFILGTRPGLKEENGVCLACINQKKKRSIDFKTRQEWLDEYIRNNITNKQYECVIAVSGGKDSHSIVSKLVENHGITNPLLVNVTDEFTHTKAGEYNLENLVNKYDLDLIKYRCKPNTFREETRKDFFESLHPLKWIEEKIYEVPIMIAKKLDIKLVFLGKILRLSMELKRNWKYFTRIVTKTRKLYF